jgi:hypothetical protein
VVMVPEMSDGDGGWEFEGGGISLIDFDMG